MAVIDFDLTKIPVKELIRGYRQVTRATPRPRSPPIQSAVDTIAAELSRRNYILCDCESGNQRHEAFDDYHNFLFWTCQECESDKWHDYHKRG